MSIGKVKWFNNEKKYGFILVDEQEIFVHFSAIIKEGYKTLKKDQEVECDIIHSARGDLAINVKPLAPPAKPRSHDQEYYLSHIPPRINDGQPNKNKYN